MCVIVGFAASKDLKTQQQRQLMVNSKIGKFLVKKIPLVALLIVNFVCSKKLQR